MLVGGEEHIEIRTAPRTSAERKLTASSEAGRKWRLPSPCAAAAVRDFPSWSILKLMHVPIYAGGAACIDRVTGRAAGSRLLDKARGIS
jgi:hypothetical protein